MPLSENSKAALQVHSLLCDSNDQWRTAFNLKNVFDRRYYAAGLAQAVGDEHRTLMSVAYSF
ncbi:hypothetical protein ACK2SD_03815 [Pseudomonas sp. SC11]|uniref:hypothetical protein n=1 Tax=Pseudomonas sp. SC11 TaxID=326927 RepID=UPI00399B8A97